jgi:hypothetical protein
MSNCVFSTVCWNTKEEFDKLYSHMIDWKHRVDENFRNPYCFTTTGTYSDPRYRLNDLKTLQIGVPYKDQDYEDIPNAINYWKIGFLTGIFHALTHVKWNILAYVHYAVLLDIDLIPIIEEFEASDKIICAPQQLSQRGNSLETGLMLMKREAAIKFATRFPARETIMDPNGGRISVEDQVCLLFENEWMVMRPDIPTIRKGLPPFYNRPHTEFEKKFEISDKAFLDLPMIFGTEKHCGNELLCQWRYQHQL